jgi:3-hydroxyacyl-CoA dehydrogenase
MKIKQDLFRDIEPLVREDTILATNTSVMSISEIASKSCNRGRIVGTHFWNPPYLIPLVEVVKGNDTTQEVLDETYAYLKRIGKKPVLCMKDVPGFIANRLQHALWREALSIVEHGIADPATVDEALRYGPGLRWPILGVLENADMIGLDLALSIQSYIVKYLEDAHEPSALLKEHVERGDARDVERAHQQQAQVCGHGQQRQSGHPIPQHGAQQHPFGQGRLGRPRGRVGAQHSRHCHQHEQQGGDRKRLAGYVGFHIYFCS